MVNIVFWFCPQLFFPLKVFFDSIVSLGIEVDNVSLDQFWNVLLLFSGVILSTRSLFTISLPLLY